MSLILSTWRLVLILHVKLLQDFNVKTYHKDKFYLVVSKADPMKTGTEELKNEGGWDFSSNLQ